MLPVGEPNADVHGSKGELAPLSAANDMLLLNKNNMPLTLQIIESDTYKYIGSKI